MEDNEIKKWQVKMGEADNMFARHSVNWKGFYKMFRGVTSSSEAAKKMRADVHVPIVGPMVLTFTARELMAFFGNNRAMTIQISGKGNKEVMRELEKRTQKSLEFVFSEPHVFTPLFNSVQDKNIFGISPVKVMPFFDVNGQIDKTKIFKTEVILPWDFLFDPQANTWLEVGWAGHEKSVSKYYLDTTYGKESAYKKIKDDLVEPRHTEGDEYRAKHRKGGIRLTEIWDRENEEVLTFVNRKHLIRKLDKFPYMFPYILGKCFTESNTPWGYGLVDVLKWHQGYANELRDLRLDDLIRNIHTRWIVPLTMQDKWESLTPGGTIGTLDMNEIPKAVSGGDVTRSIDSEVNLIKQDAYATMGVSPWTQMQIPSKRMTGREVSATIQGSGRFWSMVKNSESHFWLPWVERVLALIIDFAPSDFFDKVAGEIGPRVEPDKYVKFGHLEPKDLKKYHTQIQAKMASEILNNEEKRMEIALYVRLIGAIGPQYLHISKALQLIGETFDIPGVDEILKTDEEIQRAQMEMLKNLMAVQQGAQSYAGGGGATSIFKGGE